LLLSDLPHWRLPFIRLKVFGRHKSRPNIDFH
jgi:hypothetical protein